MANELQSLSQLFQNRLFRIPDYQRGYAWQLPQLTDFWDDLNNLQPDRYHYTGLLSLQQRKDEKANENDSWMIKKGFKPCYVVDGQQRLTTCIILLNELIGFVGALEENKGKNEENIVLDCETIRDIKAKYICQGRPPQNITTTYLFGYEVDNPSDKYLRYKVFNEPNPGELEQSYYTKNLKTAKDFFADSIKILYAEEGVVGIELMYRKLTQKLMFNLHEIEDEYDVFVAFETMNNRGKQLTNLELLKNRLIYLTTIYGRDKMEDDDKTVLRGQINDAWKEVYKQLGKNTAAALSDDDFLRAHWIIYFAYSRKKGDDYIKFLLNRFSAKNVFEKKSAAGGGGLFDDYAEAPDETLLKLEPQEIKAYVDSLKNMAPYWYDSFFPEESPSLSDREKLWLDRLNRIGIGYFRPLVAVALSKCKNEEERITLFSAVERFIFVSFRLYYLRSNYQSTVYYAAARDLYRGKTTAWDITDKLTQTTDENIQYAISAFTKTIERKLASDRREGYYAWNSLRYFLYEYEYSLWESTGVKKPSWELFSKSEKDKVSIEHILPQTPARWYWKNQFRQFIKNEDEMAALTGTLGNLLPLAQSINASLQNDSFDEKKNPANRGNRGYARGSNAEIEVAGEENWDAQRIYNRSLRLLSFMERRWNIPLTPEQKEALTFVSFVNDGRAIQEDLPIPADPAELRYQYWCYALPRLREVHGGAGHPFGNVSPSDGRFKNGYFGLKSIHLFCRLRERDCLAGLWIDAGDEGLHGGDKEHNERVFDMLYSHREAIEPKMSMPLVWGRRDRDRACSIYVVLPGTDFTKREQWEEISQFHAKMTKELRDNIFTVYESELREIDSSRKNPD